MQNAQIDDGKLHKSMDANCRNGNMQNAQIDDGRLHKSLTETTSRDYTETNTHTAGAREAPPVHHHQKQLDVQGGTQQSVQYPSQHPAMMLALWNDTIRKADQPLPLTPERKRSLSRCLTDSFEGDLDSWKDYCDQISKSPFLMGSGERGWKITLNWALDPKHIRKILDGDFQPPASSKQDPALKVKDEPMINLSQVHPLWARVCKHLIESMGIGFFNSWIAQLVPEQLDGKHPVLRAPNRFVRDIVDQRYKSRIEDVLKAFDPTIETISIGIVPIETVPTEIVTTEVAPISLAERPKQGEP